MTYDNAHHWRMMEAQRRNELRVAQNQINNLHDDINSWARACKERDAIISKLRNEVAALKGTIDSLLSDLATSESKREKAVNLGNQLTEDLANHMHELAARDLSDRTHIVQIAALASAGKALSPDARKEFINLYQTAYRSEAEANQLSTESFNLLLTEDDLDAETETAMSLET